MDAVHGTPRTFLTANGITDGDEKRAVFLSVIVPIAYRLLGSMFRVISMAKTLQSLIYLKHISSCYLTRSPESMMQSLMCTVGCSNTTDSHSESLQHQRVVESILSGIPGVVVYIDDVLVTEEEHLSALEEASAGS